MTSDPTHVKALTPDRANRRTHPPRNLALIAESLAAVGAARSIVIDDTNTVLAGNGVVQAAKQAGLTKLRVIEAAGDEIIAVRRRGLTDEQKRALALYDNRTAELATWDVAQLLADQAQGLPLTPFWTEEELAALLGAGSGGPKAGLTDPDAVPEVRATDIQRGDLFELGQHRLLCGDAMNAEDVARVMESETVALCLTDPPYGVDYAERNMARNGNAQVTLAYHEGHNAEPLIALRYMPPVIVMTYPVDRHFVSLAERLRECDYEFRRELVWIKSRPIIVLGSFYNQQHEPILVLVKRNHPLSAQTKMQLSTVFFSEKATAHEEHPTARPIELWSTLLENHSASADHVYDPFLGSGTTIIAAERLGRACRAMEIEPQYVQVALDRWQQFTGQRAVKVGEAVRR